VRLILPAWFDDPEESFSDKEAQFKNFHLLVKSNHLPAENAKNPLPQVFCATCTCLKT